MNLARPQGSGARTGRLQAIVFTLLSPLLLYLIVKSAAAMSPAMALVAARLPPSDQVSLLKQLSRSVQDPRRKVSPEVVRAAQMGLAGAPLAFEPFYIVARHEEQAGRRDRAVRIMEEARRRRPSYSVVRIWLMTYYAQAERYEPALVEMNYLLRKSVEVRRVVIPELLRLLTIARGREALASMLVTDPEWRNDFFSTAGQTGVKPEHARALYELMLAKKPNGDLSKERELVFQSMVAAGNYSGSRSVWLQTLPQAQRAANAALFDGAFRGLKAGKPFGWTFHDSATGRAEPARGDGRTYLDIAYFGGSDMVLAEQVLALRPGSYALNASARTDSKLNGAQLYWRLTCLPGTAQIGRLDLGAARSAYTRLASRFVVPQSGCSGQRLALVAEAGEVAGTANFEVTGLEVKQ